jgi:SNF2 family DNA or RNA helicase
MAKLVLKEHQEFLKIWASDGQSVYRQPIRSRIIIGDDIGLGKTIESLVIAQDHNREKIVIITLLSLKGKTWENTVKSFFPQWTVKCINNSDKIEKQLEDLKSDQNVTILSYSQLNILKRYDKTTKEDGTPIRVVNKDRTLPRLYKTIIDIEWDCIIVDEAHEIRNTKSQTFNSLKNIVKNRQGDLILVTGTPFYTKPENVFALCSLIDPVEYRSFWAWKQKYCLEAPKKSKSGRLVMTPRGQYITEIVGFRSINQIQQDLSKFFIRRERNEVLNLPDLSIETVDVELTPTQRKLYNKLYKDFQFTYKDVTITGENGAVRYRHAKSICLSPDILIENDVQIRGPKIDALDLLLSTLEGNKVIVFSHSVRCLKRLEAKYDIQANKNNENKFAYLYTGELNQKKRDAVLDKFEQNSDARVLLVSTDAGEAGLNLQYCHIAIFLDWSTSPAANDQALGRIWRLGQENPVMVYLIVALDTIEQGIIQICEDRRDLFNQVTPLINKINTLIREEKR